MKITKKQLKEMIRETIREERPLIGRSRVPLEDEEEYGGFHEGDIEEPLEQIVQDFAHDGADIQMVSKVFLYIGTQLRKKGTWKRYLGFGV